MPHLRIETNVPKSKVPEDFVVKAAAVVAKTLGKPESVLYYSFFINISCMVSLSLWQMQGHGIALFLIMSIYRQNVRFYFSILYQTSQHNTT